ncbi:MAG: hypothetical protein IJV56_10200 [Neisseriaceae bacterium]|nr:hypothetical protein [Neisseriaceae bacterium]
MIDDKDFEEIYREYLEEDIISYLAETRHISLEQAMDLYYNSKIAEKIYQGKYGIEYLDYKVLAINV